MTAHAQASEADEILDVDIDKSKVDRIATDPCRKFQRSWVFVVPATTVMTACAVLMSVLPMGKEATYVIAILFWLLFYMLLVNALETMLPNGRKYISEKSNTSRGCVWVCLIHQLVLCVTVFVYLCVYRCDPGADTWWEGLQPWWNGPWGGREMDIERHVFFCIIGYELKDLTRRGLAYSFLIHHMFVFAGCAVCLLMPASVGLVVFVGLVAEIGSGFYNADSLFGPNVSLFVFYFFAMNISNATGLWALESLFANDACPLAWAWAYATVVLLLAVLRSIGLALSVQDFMNWLESRKSNEGAKKTAAEQGADVEAQPLNDGNSEQVSA